MIDIDYTGYQGFKHAPYDRLKAELRDRRGVMRTETLFQEIISYRSKRAGYIPIYTMAHERDGLPSAYEIYMHSIDEFDAALKLVGNLRHWRRLLRLKWFQEGRAGHFEGLIQWREDMAARDYSLAKGMLIEEMVNGDTTVAKKFLDKFKGAQHLPLPHKRKSEHKRQLSVADQKISELHKVKLING